MYSQIPCQTYKICKIRNYLHISEINGAQLSRKFVDNTINTSYELHGVSSIDETSTTETPKIMKKFITTNS